MEFDEFPPFFPLNLTSDCVSTSTCRYFSFEMVGFWGTPIIWIELYLRDRHDNRWRYDENNL